MTYKSKLEQIKAFAFDVDGVLTDGRVLVCESGDLLRSYNAKDGHAVRTAVQQEYKVAIITGGVSPTIPMRFNPMGVTDIYLASFSKMPDFEDFCAKYNLQANEVLFMGDDIPDIEIMQHCGLACCPADAVPEVKAVAHYISPLVGGDACVRDVIMQVMKIQGKWVASPRVVSQ
ncbi:MAG: HAD hydrolase family protein [Prevotellaceae bacterium]|jgi:3-deoxy-D-manno-octulosonate 8-phosphate phosphatase (KDO 8-P phosphatase)|nr:HAD hydrolase family protein [Prevotellaceae bacterium]